MSTAVSVESLAVVVIVTAFALRAVFQLFPAASRRGMARLRAALGMASADAAPAAVAACNSGCGSCNSCGSSPAPRQATEAPIAFQPKSRPR